MRPLPPRHRLRIEPVLPLLLGEVARHSRDGEVLLPKSKTSQALCASSPSRGAKQSEGEKVSLDFYQKI